MNAQIVPTFAIPIGLVELDEKVYKPLRKFKGNENGLTKEEDLDFNILDKVPEIKKEFTKIFQSYINENVLKTPKQEYAITSSWITENSSGAPMVRHNHKNSYYSSVLYFDKVVEEHAALTFENPIDVSGFHVQGQEPSIFTAVEFYVPPKEGIIIFFPSYLYHYHRQFTKTKTPRKSLACNYIPINDYGVWDSSLDTRKLHG